MPQVAKYGKFCSWKCGVNTRSH